MINEKGWTVVGRRLIKRPSLGVWESKEGKKEETICLGWGDWNGGMQRTTSNLIKLRRLMVRDKEGYWLQGWAGASLIQTPGRKERIGKRRKLGDKGKLFSLQPKQLTEGGRRPLKVEFGCNDERERF